MCQTLAKHSDSLVNRPRPSGLVGVSPASLTQEPIFSTSSLSYWTNFLHLDICFTFVRGTWCICCWCWTSYSALLVLCSFPSLRWVPCPTLSSTARLPKLSNTHTHSSKKAKQHPHSGNRILKALMLQRQLLPDPCPTLTMQSFLWLW